MIKEAIATAPGIEEAQEKALAELNAPEGADVNFEVLEVPAKKVLGLFGGVPAKVRAFYELPDEIKPAREKPARAAKPVVQKTAAPTANDKPSVTQAVAEGKTIDIPEATVFLGRIFAALGVDDAKFCFVEEEADALRVTAESEKSTGSVIGRKGETLDALQTLTRLYINQAVKRYAHITLEVGDYRAKRAEHLRHLAQKTAARVLKTGRNTSLDPMSPFERRIVHTAISEIEGVESHSVGFDEGRKVLITPVGKFEERPARDRGSYGDRGRRPAGGGRGFDRDRRPGGRSFDRKPPYQPQAPARPPRSDSGGAALYGKVEVPKKEQED
ncbi:MAG: Jag N-terminal domain-containing protein [Clostridium sp.]|jgi:spoIIIJ-associated protein|nr:Jag N-terminal domain-containing protein [Clostridium sp.]